MTDAFSEERLAQLDERWRRDPSSRIFVQLAEEYRRGGRLREALGVLEQGLVHHPTYVSALVVLGRCRLEAGEAEEAAQALERALAHDPAQLVANKLLVEAYLRSARPGKAQERLDFYRLVNARDAEIDGLARRIAAASGARPPAPRPAVAPAPRPVAAPAPIFDLGPLPARAARVELAPPAAARGRGAGAPFGDLHDPAAAARRIVRALAAGGLFPIAIVPEPVPAPVVVPAPLVGSLAATVPPAAVELEALAPPAPSAVEIEAPAPPAPAPAAAEEAVPWWRGAPEPVSPAAAPAVEEAPAAPIAEAAAAPPAVEAAEAVPPWGAGLRSAPELDLEARAEVVAEPFSPRTIGEEVERETIEEPFDEVLEASSTTAALPRQAPEPPPPAFEPIAPEQVVAAPGPPAEAPVAPAPEPPATPAAAVGPSATLGELYLQQGFVDEAEREFRAVLEVRPGDAVATAGLEEIRLRRAGERPQAPAPRTLPAGLTQRKIETLRGYLDRLMRGREAGHVS